MRWMWLLLGGAALLLFAGMGWADEADPKFPPEVYEESFKALMVLFVLAVLIESALAVIFNWRVFLAYFNLRGVKTIIMIIVSFSVVKVFDIDIVAKLMQIYGGSSETGSTISVLLTALILAGGSSGVNNVFVALGFRSQRADTQPKPPRTEAWVAVYVEREHAQGEVLVQIEAVDNVQDPDHSQIAGFVGRSPRSRMRDLLLPNASRFPHTGGYQLDSNKVYRITTVGKDASGEPVTGLGETFSFAPRAIVDLSVRM